MTLISDRGFTLIEVLIAIVIIGIALGLIIALFGGGLRTAQVTRGYSRALLLARDKLDEGLNESGYVIQEGEETGAVRGFKWKRAVEPYHHADDDPGNIGGLFMVDVKVDWNDGIRSREVTLQSLISKRQALQ